jgi:hypothetical protein
MKEVKFLIGAERAGNEISIWVYLITHSPHDGGQNNFSDGDISMLQPFVRSLVPFESQYQVPI